MKIEKRIAGIEDKIGHITSEEIPQWALTVVRDIMKAENRICWSYGKNSAYSEKDVKGEMAIKEAQKLFRKYRTLEEYHRRSIVGLGERLRKALEEERKRRR